MVFIFFHDCCCSQVGEVLTAASGDGTLLLMTKARCMHICPVIWYQYGA